VVTRQWGLQITKVMLESNGTVVAGNVVIADPNDSTVLLNIAPATGATTAGIVLYNENFFTALKWRDFRVTGLTATVTKLYIWYRA